MFSGFLDLDRGKLTSGDTQVWHIEGTLNEDGDPWEEPVSQEVIWTVPTDKKVTVQSKRGNVVTTIGVLDTDMGDASVAIHNFMPEDIIRYLKTRKTTSPTSDPDRDFKWYYELFEGSDRHPQTPKGWIVHALDGLELPIPRAIGPSGRANVVGENAALFAPTGQNCLPALFPETQW